VLASILVISASLILWLQGKVVAQGRYQIIAGKSFRPMELKLGAWRKPLFIFCVAYIAFTILLPTAIIFLVGGLRTYGLPFTWENLSLKNFYFILFEYRVTRQAIWNSVTLGLSAAVITMFTGLMISYVIVKMKVRGKGILELLGMLPFSVPGSVIALGVILTWSGRYGINLYNTVWIILVAYIARYMAFSLRANSAALAQVHDSLMEAGRVCGATMWQTLKDIVFPLVRPGMLASFFLIFLPSLRELTISIMLYAPNTRTIGVAIYTLNEDGETVRAAALAGIALIIIVLGQLLVNRLFGKGHRISGGG
jgi:iron(III) transport system permease protein